MLKIVTIIGLATGIANAAWECYAVNNYGYYYWGTGMTQYQATNNAVKTCQLNTPYGGTCWITSSCTWY